MTDKITFDFKYERVFKEPRIPPKNVHLPCELLAQVASFLTLELRHRIFKLVSSSFKDAVIASDLLPEVVLNNRKERIIQLLGTKMTGAFGGKLSLMKLPFIQVTKKELQFIKETITPKYIPYPENTDDLDEYRALEEAQNPVILRKKVETFYLEKIQAASLAIVQFYKDDQFVYCLFGRVTDLSPDQPMTSILVSSNGTGYIFYGDYSQYHSGLIDYLSDLFKKVPRGHRQTYSELIDPTRGVGGWGNNIRDYTTEGPKQTNGAATVSLCHA